MICLRVGSEINVHWPEGIFSLPGGLQLLARGASPRPCLAESNQPCVDRAEDGLHVFHFEHFFFLSLDLPNSMHFLRENGTDILGSLLLAITVLYLIP